MIASRWHAAIYFICCYFITITGEAQVNNYTFTSTEGTYTEITGGTLHGTASNDDNSFNAIPIGFSFVFNGRTYTTVSINSNGFIAMGSSVASSYTCISTGMSNNVISAFSDNLKGSTTAGMIPELRSLMSGTAPNRVFTVQWKNYSSGTSTDNFNFQIKLYETSNQVEVVYGPMTTCCGSIIPVQVGLRGSLNTDFNNRAVDYSSTTWATSTAGTTNAAICEFAYYWVPPAGLTYRWTQPTLDLAVTDLPQPIGCYGADQAIMATVTNMGSQSINFASNPANLTLNITGPNPKTFNVPLTGTLAPGSSTTITVSTAYDMSQEGIYTFNPAVTMTGDLFAGNDSRSFAKPVFFPNPVALPVFVNFADYDGENLSTAFPGWREASGAAPSGDTSYWEVNTASQQTFFGGQGRTARMIFFGTNTREEWLISPNFIPGDYTQFQFKTAVTAYFGTGSATMGSDDKVYVAVSTDCGATWTNIKTFDLSSGLTTALASQDLSLAEFSGQEIIIAFHGSEGSIANSSNFYDFHIDDINIKNVFPFDAGISALVSPSSGTCSNCNYDVKVLVNNYGTDDLSSIPLNVLITGSETILLKDTLAFLPAGEEDTVLLTTPFMPLTGGPYTIFAFTTHPQDIITENDTLEVSLTFVDNPWPAPIDEVLLCNASSVTLNTTGNAVKWYDSPLGGNLVGTGTSFTTPVLSSSTTYYAESSKPYNTSITTNFTGDRQSWGNMFDLKALNTITIDSFDLHLNTTAAETIEIYYRSGSYIGAEEDPSQWTLLGSATVTGRGFGNPTPVSIGGLTLQAGESIGLYITGTVDDIFRYTAPLSSGEKQADSNVEFTFGIAIYYPFNTIIEPRLWNGTMHYTSNCTSPRVPANIVVSQVEAQISGNQTVCEGKEAELQVSFTGNPPFSFTYTDGVNANSFTEVMSSPFTFKVKPDFISEYSLLAASGYGCPGIVSGSAQVNLDPLPQLDLLPANTIICKGNSVQLYATGADTYLWSPAESLSSNAGPEVTAFPIETTTYTVVGTTPMGCTDTATVDVTVADPPDATFNYSPVVCGNEVTKITYSGDADGIFFWDFGGATVIAGSGKGPYFVKWPDNGTKTITLNIEEGGCMGLPNAQNIEVVAPPAIPLVTADVPELLCEGDSVLLFTDSSELLQWNDEQSTAGPILVARRSGVYSVTAISPEGCRSTSEAIDLIFYPLPNKPVITLLSETPLCEGETAVLRSNFALGNTWSDGSTGTGIVTSQPGTYTVSQESKEGCMNISDPVVLEFYPKPSKPTITLVGTTLVCNEDAPVYQWFSPTGPVSGATGKTFEPTVSDLYTVALVSAEGCESDHSEAYTYGVSVSEVAVGSIRLYPNPGDGNFVLEINNPMTVTQVRIFDVAGREVYRQEEISRKMQVNARLSPGSFQVQVIAQDRTLWLPLIVR